MKRIILLLSALAFLFSCDKRTEDEQEGPNIQDIFGDFQLLVDFDISNRNVDFSEGETTHFTATFNKLIEWEIEIEGLTSGAKKVLSGVSSELDNTNATWTGNTSSIPIFTVEECAVELRFLTDTITFLDTLNIDGIKSNEGFIIADFETGFNSGWNTFVQSGADMSFNITNDVFPGEGDFYYDMGGEVNWDYLIGLIDFPATAYDNGFDVTDNASDVYFNVFLNKPEGIGNEIVLFQFREDDDQDGSFNESTEDMYSLELAGLQDGWQQISIPYEELQVLVNGQPSTPNGNALHEPNKLWQISVLFLADPASGYSQTFMDYLIFTEGGPLNP